MFWPFIGSFLSCIGGLCTGCIRVTILVPGGRATIRLQERESRLDGRIKLSRR